MGFVSVHGWLFVAQGKTPSCANPASARMASKKVTQILLSKTDLDAEAIAELSDSEGWAIIYSMAEEKRQKRLPQLCLTGFRRSEKEALRAVAEEAGYAVVSRVTTRLSVLVAGENAGPSKLQRAAEVGARVLTAAELRVEAERA